MKFIRLLITITLLGLSSCRWGGYDKEIALVEAQKAALGCAPFETLFWDAFDQFLVSEKRIPSLSALQGKISDFEKQKSISNSTKEAWLRLNQVLLAEAAKDHYRTPQQLRMFFAAMEVGDESSFSRKEIKIKIYAAMKALESSTAARSCAGVSENKTLPESFSAPSEISLAEKGMRWLFATAYQSCEAVKKPAIQDQTPDVQGILDLGMHPDGVGHLRKISDRHLFTSSHYYYHDLHSGPLCRTEIEMPLIYDYGGKPFAEDGLSSSLDLFKNDGTGGEALGIDCAAAIFSAATSAGLSLKPNVPLRARQVLGVNSRMFKDPLHNGLECFRPIKVGAEASIQSGDIAAVNGHVLMVGETGSDPLTSGNFNLEKDCDSITFGSFDFKIWQSGPQKGGIGLNHIEAKDYLKDATKMREGFEAYARLACHARLQKKEIEPELEKFAIVRHRGTPECTAQRLSLKGEACIQDCPAIF